MTRELKAPFPCFGGKSRAVPAAWDALGDVRNTWKARKGYALTSEVKANTAGETLWCSPHCVPVEQSTPELLAA